MVICYLEVHAGNVDCFIRLVGYVIGGGIKMTNEEQKLIELAKKYPNKWKYKKSGSWIYYNYKKISIIIYSDEKCYYCYNYGEYLDMSLNVSLTIKGIIDHKHITFKVSMINYIDKELNKITILDKLKKLFND